MSKKTLLISECFEAYKLLCEHRGIPFHEENFYINPKKTMQEIESTKLNILNQCGEKLDLATQKQMSFISSLAKNFNEEKRFDDIKLNKYQASYLINIYKNAINLLYSNCTYAMNNETWEEIDKEIKYIIEHTRI